MKLSKWSVVGMLSGIAFALFSGVRYFLIYPDTDKAITDVIIGILIVACAWLYGMQLSMRNKFDAVEEYLADKNQKEVK